MNNLTVIENNGILVVDSREAAKVLEVRHSDLLRDIEKYIGALENSENAKLRSQEFFIESTYTTGGNNKEYKNYLLTKKGCELVAHKRTGKDGVIFTALYIEQFHLMEEVLRKPMTIEDLIIMQAQEVKKVKEKVDNLEYRVENKITLDSGEQRNETKEVGKRVYERSEKTGVPVKILYQALYRDLKDIFGVASYKDIKQKDLEDALKYIKNWIEIAEIREHSGDMDGK